MTHVTYINRLLYLSSSLFLSPPGGLCAVRSSKLSQLKHVVKVELVDINHAGEEMVNERECMMNGRETYSFMEWMFLLESSNRDSKQGESEVPNHRCKSVPTGREGVRVTGLAP